MIDVQWKPALAKMRGEWLANPRLRYGAMVIIAIVGLQVLLAIAGAVHRRMASYDAAADLLGRMDGMRNEAFWPERAKAAQAMLKQVNAHIPAVASAGMAQAEAQAWLAQLAADQHVTQPQIKAEPAVAVAGYPDLWQVMARLDGVVPAHGEQPVLQALAKAMPWVQVERMELATGASPRFVITVRSYYRKPTTAAAHVDVPAGTKDQP